MRPGRVGWDCIGTGRFPLRFPKFPQIYLFPTKTPPFRSLPKRSAKMRAPPPAAGAAAQGRGREGGWRAN